MPPLNPLRVFDVAARSSSFTQAAGRLHVSQAAVSRQIGTLEGFFDVKLFDRNDRSLTLTSEGRRLHRCVGPAFDAIGSATAEILHKRDPNVVTIQTYPTMIVQKLLPRLPRLLDANRKLEIHFSQAVRPEEFSFAHADIILRLEPELPSGIRGFCFAQDVIVPAAAPDLIPDSERACGDLFKGRPLLTAKFRHSDWPDWAKAAHVDLSQSRFAHFESSLLAYQAAYLGGGVCMAQEFLIAADLASGRLKLASEKRLKRQAFYCCLVSGRRVMSRPLKATLDWLETMRQEA
jgi:LysR family glycine cleavage system transcriptional activator